jgi:hypothetical protein
MHVYKTAHPHAHTHTHLHECTHVGIFDILRASFAFNLKKKHLDARNLTGCRERLGAARDVSWQCLR